MSFHDVLLYLCNYFNCLFYYLYLWAIPLWTLLYLLIGDNKKIMFVLVCWSIVCFTLMVVVIIFYKFKVPSVSYFYLHMTRGYQCWWKNTTLSILKVNVVCIVFLIFDLFTIENILLTNWYNIFRVFTVDLAVHKPECDVYWYLLTTATYCSPPPCLIGKTFYLGFSVLWLISG